MDPFHTGEKLPDDHKIVGKEVINLRSSNEIAWKREGAGHDLMTFSYKRDAPRQYPYI